MEKEIPEHLDWVARRADCSPKKAFELLRGEVEADVEAFNSRPEIAEYSKVAFESGGNSYFVVFRRQELNAEVTFSLNSNRIEIQDSVTSRSHTAAPTLSTNGQRQFIVADQVYFPWQLRRLALESLLFPANRGF